MIQKNKFINAEIPITNKHEAEAAAKKAEELGYEVDDILLKYKDDSKYLTLTEDGCFGFWSFKDKRKPTIPLSDFLNQPQTETITLDNGEKWRVQLIEKVEDEPMSAEEFFYSQEGVGNAPQWMEAYAQYRLKFEREKANQQHKTN